MQDFRNYSFKLTVKDLERIINEDGQQVVVIINGEYYDLIKGESENKPQGESDLF